MPYGTLTKRSIKHWQAIVENSGDTAKGKFVQTPKKVTITRFPERIGGKRFPINLDPKIGFLAGYSNGLRDQPFKLAKRVQPPYR